MNQINYLFLDGLKYQMRSGIVKLALSLWRFARVILKAGKQTGKRVDHEWMSEENQGKRSLFDVKEERIYGNFMKVCLFIFF